MIYVIGERNGGNPARHQTSRRLAALCNVSEAELLQQVVWINLFDVPGTNPRLTVDMVEHAAVFNDAILLLGRRVARAWGLPTLAPLGTVTRNAGRGPVIVAVPHPSGLNRWWNDPDHFENAALYLSRIWLRYHHR